MSKGAEMFHRNVLGPEQVGLKMLARRIFTGDIADVNRRRCPSLGQ